MYKMIWRLGWTICNWEIWKQPPECDRTGQGKLLLLKRRICHHHCWLHVRTPQPEPRDKVPLPYLPAGYKTMRPQPWHVPVNRCRMLLLNAHEAREQTPGPLLELPQKSQIPPTCQQTQKQLKCGLHLSMFTSASKPHTLHSPFKKLARSHTKPKW